MKPTILLVDDDPMDLVGMERLVASWGYRVLTARSAKAALEYLAQDTVDLVISDLRMPDMDGAALLAEIVAHHTSMPTILLTGQGDIPSAVSAIKNGAFDYILKPANPDELRLTAQRALDFSRLGRENRFLKQTLHLDGAGNQLLVGSSPAMATMNQLIRQAARVDSTVLITGETGTGKELVARALHAMSPRCDKPFIAFNCAAIPPNLLESELFGHEKGAFTGATAMRRGRFEEANGGTVLLDEIADAPLEFQAKLLRVLQERQIERLGSSQTHPIDVRVLASTHRDMKKAISENKFREDLFYRLDVLRIHVVPLRERREDIPLLVSHFAEAYRHQYHLPSLVVSPRAMEHLAKQDWAGNVRELRHAIERAVVLSPNGQLDLSSFQGSGKDTAPTMNATLDAHLDRATREHVVRVLDQVQWHKQEAADRLGVDRATLYRLMKRLGLDKGN